MFLSMAVASFAQTDKGRYDYFRKGFYLGTEVSSGFSVNERISDRGRNSCYGLDIAAGYRFRPQLAIGIGFGGHAFTSRTTTCGGTVEREVETTSVPVFIRIRSDFMDRRVSPYLQLDMGYSFVFLYSRDALGKVKYNDKVFMDRVNSMGFETLDDYEAFCRSRWTDLSADEADRLWSAELNRLKCFSNGRRDYIALENTHVQYGKNGLFANLDFGVSWKVGDNYRMNAGISAGLSQSYYGTCLRTLENEFIHFGREDYLPYEKEESKVFVRTVGQQDFLDSFDVDLRVKIGFSF